MAIDQAFNNTVAYYDDWMMKALPSYHKVFSISREVIPFDSDARIDVLDLGAGTGLFSKHVWEKYPNARFVLYDVAAQMIEAARGRFQTHQDQFTFIIDDYRNIHGLQDFDLVISSLSIHHLSNDDKRMLFDRVYASLRDGGLFINIDQIKGQTRYLQELYWTKWLDRVRENGASEDNIQESIHRRKTYDQDALMSDQLHWLREAGFANVDCIYKHYFVGVFLATK